MDAPVEDIGSRSCVTRFVKTLLSIMEHGVKPHSKHLTEYFAFLYEFAKMGEEEVTPASFISLATVLLFSVELGFHSRCCSRFTRRSYAWVFFVFVFVYRASSCCPCRPSPSWCTSTWVLKVLRT